MSTEQEVIDLLRKNSTEHGYRFQPTPTSADALLLEVEEEREVPNFLTNPTDIEIRADYARTEESLRFPPGAIAALQVGTSRVYLSTQALKDRDDHPSYGELEREVQTSLPLSEHTGGVLRALAAIERKYRLPRVLGFKPIDGTGKWCAELSEQFGDYFKNQ